MAKDTGYSHPTGESEDRVRSEDHGRRSPIGTLYQDWNVDLWFGFGETSAKFLGDTTSRADDEG